MKYSELNGKLIAAIRIRGRVNVDSRIADTMNRLRLPRVNNCAIIKVDSAYAGMLEKCVNHIAFGEIDEKTLEKLMKKYLPGENPKEVFEGKKDIKDFRDSMPFRLRPPKHGLRSSKLSYMQGGSLGYMGSSINELLNRMI
ncbi:MAG: uL30 family ribosomal protein [Candidatus Micrarchaeaceae archaeon]